MKGNLEYNEIETDGELAELYNTQKMILNHALNISINKYNDTLLKTSIVSSLDL